jgi:hypothetical protein
MAGLAGRLSGLLQQAAQSKVGQRLLDKGGKDLLVSAVPGAALTTVLSTVTTGNPLAGLAIGAADLGLGFGAARALGGTRFAGKFRNYASDDDVAKYSGVSRNIPASALKREYVPSMAQNAAMIGSSAASVIGLEPLFLQMQQQQNTNQMITQQQQLGQQEVLNQMYTPYTADGTLYQLQGLPYRVIEGQ